jgi:hypothetical protein
LLLLIEDPARENPGAILAVPSIEDSFPFVKIFHSDEVFSNL